MKARNKIITYPPDQGGTFKEFFSHAAASGAGRPTGKDGLPLGPWTSDLLAQAILEADPAGVGVDLRTVQLWFQDNDRGISSTNIRLLARVFGGGEPEAVSKWQISLTSSLALQKRQRTNKKNPKKLDVIEIGYDEDKGNGLEGGSYISKAVSDVPANEVETGRIESSPRLAVFTKRLFCRSSSLDTPSAVFAGAIALGFMSFLLGVHNVKYQSLDGVEKQVGFLWAPNWTFIFIALMPLFILFSSAVVKVGRAAGLHVQSNMSNDGGFASGYRSSVDTSGFTFWAIFVVCIIFAGMFQWIGVRLVPLLSNSNIYAIDWGTYSIARPDIVSEKSLIIFTAVAYAYMAVCYYLLFSGLALIHLVVIDINGSDHIGVENFDGYKPVYFSVYLSEAVLTGVFRCALLSLQIAIAMKIQSFYLTSNSPDILTWLMSDLKSIVVHGEATSSYAEFSMPNQFTSLVVVIASSFVFLDAVLRLRKRYDCKVVPVAMAIVFFTLVFGYFIVATFSGYTIFLGISLALSVCAMIDPYFKILRFNCNRKQGHV